jgi:hypothetical protein
MTDRPPVDPPPVHPEIWPEVESPVGLDPAIEDRVTEIIAAMTVEDKVGQVIQAEINNVTPEEVKEYRLGSVLNGGGGWPNREKYSTPEDWLALADAFWEASMDVSEGGQAIPIIWGLDAVHGHNNVIGATIFPHNIGLGAADNPDLVREIGRITAREMAVTGQDWNFGPTIAVARDDRWGRTPESYSEDPEIVATCGEALVEGLQGVVGADATSMQQATSPLWKPASRPSWRRSTPGTASRCTATGSSSPTCSKDGWGSTASSSATGTRTASSRAARTRVARKRSTPASTCSWCRDIGSRSTRTPSNR